jgi:hypothetical protein
MVKPSGKPNESESKWFKRALHIAHEKVGLEPYAQGRSADPVENLYEELYVKIRTALFHAKGSRPSLLPHDGANAQTNVGGAVERLGHLVMKLAESELNTRTSSSFIYPSGFDLITEHLLKNVSLHATDDPNIKNPNNTMINPTGGTVINLETRHAPELEKPYVRTWFGHVNGAQVEKLARLSGLVSTMEVGKLFTCGTIEGVLKLLGISRLECQMSLRVRNVQQPRGFFSS